MLPLLRSWTAISMNLLIIGLYRCYHTLSRSLNDRSKPLFGHVIWVIVEAWLFFTLKFSILLVLVCSQLDPQSREKPGTTIRLALTFRGSRIMTYDMFRDDLLFVDFLQISPLSYHLLHCTTGYSELLKILDMVDLNQQLFQSSYPENLSVWPEASYKRSNGILGPLGVPSLQIHAQLTTSSVERCLIWLCRKSSV